MNQPTQRPFTTQEKERAQFKAQLATQLLCSFCKGDAAQADDTHITIALNAVEKILTATGR